MFPVVLVSESLADQSGAGPLRLYKGTKTSGQLSVGERLKTHAVNTDGQWKSVIATNMAYYRYSTTQLSSPSH